MVKKSSSRLLFLFLFKVVAIGFHPDRIIVERIEEPTVGYTMAYTPDRRIGIVTSNMAVAWDTTHVLALVTLSFRHDG